MSRRVRASHATCRSVQLSCTWLLAAAAKKLLEPRHVPGFGGRVCGMLGASDEHLMRPMPQNCSRKHAWASAEQAGLWKGVRAFVDERTARGCAFLAGVKVHRSVPLRNRAAPRVTPSMSVGWMQVTPWMTVRTRK